MKTKEEMFKEKWRGHYYPEHVLKKLLGEDGYQQMKHRMDTEFVSTGTAGTVMNYFGLVIEDIWETD